jgi:hypothetical protein
MSKKQLAQWVASARWNMISEYTVAWVAAESSFASELAHEWIDSPREHVAAAGWNTWSGIVSLRADDELDLKELETLLKRVEQKIDGAQNRVRYCMNGFVMAVGSSVLPLLARAKATAKKLGKVQVDWAAPPARSPSRSKRSRRSSRWAASGKKRKTTKC